MKHRLRISTEKASKQTSDHALPLGCILVFGTGRVKLEEQNRQVSSILLCYMYEMKDQEALKT